jgi:hypothetical protein
MKRLPRDQHKKLQDDAKLLRAWKAWHREQLELALAGPAGAIVADVVSVLNHLNIDSAGKLLACVQAVNWTAVSYSTRLTLLHQINERITQVREGAGLVGLDDPLAPAMNMFFVVKATMFPSNSQAGSEFSGQRNASGRGVLRPKHRSVEGTQTWPMN